jgi:serine/threonine-protein kinase
MSDGRGKAASIPTVQVTVEAGPHKGTVVVWNRPGAYLVGRSPKAQLPLLHDLLVSLEHCRVEIQEHGCWIHDLGSRRGTIVNGLPVGKSAVRSGDRLQVGMSSLVFAIDDPLATATPLPGGPQQATTSSGRQSNVSPSGHGFLDIPGYAITRKLGVGGMGVVYDAVRPASGERVAIKTIIPAPGTAHRSVELFRREMKVLAQLEHPRIVRYIESGEFAGQVYLAMEYVDCIDLEATVQSLPRARQIEIFCGVMSQVLEALEYAHAQKLVHRDIKPRNILVARQGQRLEAKLADFGLAKNFEMAGLSQLTADHEIRGTPAFMPWEQLRDSRYAKPTVDLYSTAATLYYFLVGRPPGHTRPSKKSWLSMTSLFVGAGRSVLRAAEEPTNETEFADLPRGLANFLIQALSFSPKHRFPTAAAMRLALRPFCPRTDI